MLTKPAAAEGGKAAARRNPVTKKIQAALELRAQWLVKHWNRNPTTSYPERIAAIRERFGCGETAAEVAHARAREIIAENTKDLGVPRLVALYERIIEEALSKDKFQAAIRAVHYMGLATGHVAPTRHSVDVKHSGRVDVEHRAHIAALQLTPIERRHREAHLLAKGGLIDVDPETLDAVVSNALAEVASEDQLVDVDDEGT